MRSAIHHKFEFTAGHEGYINPGFYEDGRLGEMFIEMQKEGTMVKGLTDALGTSISLGLQYGVPTEAYVTKFKHQKFDPRGLMTEAHPEIHEADSIVDYLAQFMEKVPNFDSFMKIIGLERIGKNKPEKKSSEIILSVKNSAEENVNGTNNQKGENGQKGELGGQCAVCGSQMIKDGRCIEACSKCGWTDPKGCGQ